MQISFLKEKVLFIVIWRDTDWEKQTAKNVYVMVPILLKTKQNKDY